MSLLDKLGKFSIVILLFVLPLTCGTIFLDAVRAPKQAVFWLGTSLLVSVFVLGAYKREWPLWPRSKAAGFAFVFYMWQVIAGLLSGVGPHSFSAMADSVFYGILVLAFCGFMQPEKEGSTGFDNHNTILHWLGWISLSAAIAGFYCYLQRITPLGIQICGIPICDPLGWDNPHLSQERTIATLGNPNYLAAWLIAVLPLFFTWNITRSSKWLKVTGFSVWLAVALAMVLTQTRAAWVGGLAAAFLWLVKIGIDSSAETFKKMAKISALLAIVISCAVVSVGVLQYENKVEFSIFNRVKSITDFQDLSFRTRVYFWKSALLTLKDSPIWGVGPNGQMLKSLGHRELEPFETRYPARVPENSHNQYLQTLTDGGIVGFALLALSIYFFFKQQWKYKGLVSAGIISAACAHWVTQFFICSTVTTETLWIFLIGCSCCFELENDAKVKDSSDTAEDVADENNLDSIIDSTEQSKRSDTCSSDTGLANLVFLVCCFFIILVTTASVLSLSTEYNMRLGDDARSMADHMRDIEPDNNVYIVGMYHRALDYYESAEVSAPSWKTWLVYQRQGSVYASLYYVLPDSTDKELMWYKSREYYQMALALYPKYPHNWVNLARLLASHPGHGKDALETINEGLTLDPRNPEYLLLKAQILMDSKNPSQALDTLDKALNICPQNNYLLFAKAVSLYQLQKDKEAEEVLKEVEKIDPSSKRACLELRQSKGR